MKLWALLSICTVAFFASCQKSPPETARQSSESSRAAATDPATAATISGTVSFAFQGTPPKPAPIDMSADPGCQGTNSSESLLVNDGKLQNVFVYVDGGFTFVPPHNPVVVEQKGCKYIPHVVAAAVMQPVEFRNLDATIHNIHGAPQANDAWNASQPNQALPMTRTFAHAETMIPVKCNQHPWMKMYINISASPFFAVTDAHGHFELTGIPPGTYNLVLVHETLGKQTQSITVGPKEEKKLEVSFAR